MSRSAAHEFTYTQLDAMFPPLVEGETGTTHDPLDETAIGANGDPGAMPESDWRANLDVEAMREATEAGAAVGVASNRDTSRNESGSGGSARARSGDASIEGLSDIPESWPSMPSNASLSVEVQWVLANRLRVIEERGDSVSVDLSRALTPAPSYAALGWLETSIRVFPKFIDVSARATASTQDDQDKVRREKLAIEEIRSLLAEMAGESKRG